MSTYHETCAWFDKNPFGDITTVFSLHIKVSIYSLNTIKHNAANYKVYVDITVILNPEIQFMHIYIV